MQKSFSPVDVLSGEQWLAEMGLITAPTADNLLGYAYMQPGVEKAEVKIDLDFDNGGARPKVEYAIKLSRSLFRRYTAMGRYSKQRGIWPKIMMFWYLKIGVPFPGTIEDNISYLAMGFLPANYSVTVNVERS